MPFRLVMLSPYRMPTHHALMLGPEDTLAWQHAWRLLWHPALLRQAPALPMLAEEADHAVPQAQSLYVMPASPPPYLPENWQELARQAGALFVYATQDWQESRSRLQQALANMGQPRLNLETDNEATKTCFSLGFGYAMIETLFEAMEHTKVLDAEAFFAEIQCAAAGASSAAKAAAERLMAARETVYPAPIHLLDLAILGQGTMPASLNAGLPLTLIATTESLQQHAEEQRAALVKKVSTGQLEICAGVDHERPDAVLPVESQLWNLQQGQQRMRDWLGRPASAFARPDAAFHPYLPNWLGHVDISKLVYISFDGGTLPHHAAATIRWPAPDGRHVDAVTRVPLPANDPQTGFHLPMHLHQTIMQDSSAVLLLLHGEPSASCWYDDWLALSMLAPVLGTWTTASRFLDDATVGEYASAASMDEFSPEVPAGRENPNSSLAAHARLRRRLDAASTYQALLQSLGTPVDEKLARLYDELEAQMERRLGIEPPALIDFESTSAAQLARRLVARSTGRSSGRMLLNPCPFARRVGLEWIGIKGMPQVGGAVKAVQRDGDITRLVVEIPGLGYTWVADDDAEPPTARMVLARGTTVRNEFFEAEIDPDTGGIHSLRETHGRDNLIGQQLVWQPGSRMKANDVRVTACGPALGEVTAHGELLDDHGGCLARFTQRFRAWPGRPLLELHVELQPVQPPTGQPWHAYYGARFAARDDRATLVRGVFGHRSATTQQRPGSPDFLEFQVGKNCITVVTGGLPFAQRHGPRMADVLLVMAGESGSSFDLAIGLNRSQPAQSAQAFVSPVAVAPLEHGPPASGVTGWLAHLDSAHVLLTSLRPAKEANAVVARLFEIGGVGGAVNLRFARIPRAAALVDGSGLLMMDALVDDDNVSCEVMAHDLVNLRVEWP